MISQECIDFLKEIGADKKGHSGRTLFDHLVGTSDILEKNGAPQYLQDAGLFHSIYGTVSFMPGGGMVSFDERDKIRSLIGERAEEIAYTFCMLDSPRVENISRMNEGDLKNDLIFLNTYHQDELRNEPTMSWEEAYNL